MRRKPIIGITPNYEADDRIGVITDLGTTGQDWNYISGDYIRMIEKAGGIPVVIPVESTENIDRILRILDGLIVSGGSDISPSVYGEEPKEGLGKVNIERDLFEVELLKAAIEKDMPVLGICRGTQLINIAMGGTLYQDNGNELGVGLHSRRNFPRNMGWHEVTFTEGSRFRDIFKKKSVMTNSYHHQSVKDLGEGVVVVGRTNDNIVEAIEIPSKTYVIGVQWHPEMMYDSDEELLLCKSFVEECKRRG